MDQIVLGVINKLQTRSAIGLRKYGTSIWRNTDENYFKHLQDELLDGANYCEQMLRLGEFSTQVVTLIENEPNDQELGKKIREAYNKLLDDGIERISEAS